MAKTSSASSGHYNTSADALMALKKANVTDKEIGAMQFVIYVIEGQSPGEYRLLHLHTHSDGRESPGDYGFLPPTTMNSGKNMASLGKMYTFSITELTLTKT